MGRVIGVFMLYLLINIIYLFMVGNPMYDCTTWNNITSLYVLLINVGAIFTTIVITRREFSTINQRFLIRTSASLVYLVMMYIIMSGQYLMLTC